MNEDKLVASCSIEVRRDEKGGLYYDVKVDGENIPIILAMIDALSSLLKTSMKDGVTEDEISDCMRGILRDILEEG